MGAITAAEGGSVSQARIPLGIGGSLVTFAGRRKPIFGVNETYWKLNGQLRSTDKG